MIDGGSGVHTPESHRRKSSVYRLFVPFSEPFQLLLDHVSSNPAVLLTESYVSTLDCSVSYRAANDDIAVNVAVGALNRVAHLIKQTDAVLTTGFGIHTRKVDL